MYARTRILGSGWQTDFFLRETTPRIMAIPPSPTISLRAGLIVQRGVGMVIVMVELDEGRFGHELFETWWNIHQAGGERKYFEDMTGQATIRLHLYGDTRQRERRLQIENSVRAFFRTALEELGRLPSWSMVAFDRARETLYRRYPTLQALWDALPQ
jgi:hypothetical protein